MVENYSKQIQYHACTQLLSNIATLWNNIIRRDFNYLFSLFFMD